MDIDTSIEQQHGLVGTWSIGVFQYLELILS
ncbi:hypothetical protein LILAB_29565 [Corallococcus macrosporus]|uniref:Uncharacterized protein n=1 Tax=Myxococcus fulvus (strain ATCC BAA-855 / HW-1) TaxID=483219 RepID=F8CMY8_MYXFH|nr:hypothetical protein LILAB_29565 [Corallococcus macrosporus]